MMVRSYILSILLLLISSQAVATEPIKLILSTDVRGFMEDKKGNIFAILKEHGLVSIDDVITITKDGVEHAVRIIDIKPDSLKVKLLKSVIKKPDPIQRKQYDIRDPFWPSNFDPK